MKLISNSTPCCKSELDLFYSPPTNTSILSSSYSTVAADQFDPKDENFYINVEPTDAYTDLNDIYLSVDVQIKNGTENFSADDKIGVINNLGHSLFKSIDLSIGKDLKKELVEKGNSHYAYKAYLLTLLNYGSDAKSTWIQSGLFYKDEPGYFDEIGITEKKSAEFTDSNSTRQTLDVYDKCNKGFIQRRTEFVNGDGTVKMIIPLYCDLLQSNRLLVDGMELYFNFERNKDTFILMGEATGCSIVIKKLSVSVRRCQIHEKVKLAHINALQISPFKYPIKQNKIHVASLNAGSEEYTFSSPNSKIPNKIIVGIITDKAYNGSLKDNPFNFTDHGLICLTLTVNDTNRLIKINAAKNDFVEGYHALCESLNMYGQTSNDITKLDYAKGNCLFCFNLNSDKGCEEQFNPLKDGSISFTLNFKEAPKSNLKVVCLMEHDNQININKDYNVAFDYNLI